MLFTETGNTEKDTVDNGSKEWQIEEDEPEGDIKCHAFCFFLKIFNFCSLRCNLHQRSAQIPPYSSMDCYNSSTQAYALPLASQQPLLKGNHRSDLYGCKLVLPLFVPHTNAIIQYVSLSGFFHSTVCL